MNSYLKYQFNDWLSADVRLGTDFYALNADARVWTGSSRRNSYATSEEKFYENNYIANLTAKKIIYLENGVVLLHCTDN